MFRCPIYSLVAPAKTPTLTPPSYGKRKQSQLHRKTKTPGVKNRERLRETRRREEDCKSPRVGDGKQTNRRREKKWRGKSEEKITREEKLAKAPHDSARGGVPAPC